MAASFPPSARLHDQRDFSRVFQRQRKAAGRYVVVLAARRPRKAGETPRLGVVVSTKTARTAVRRHQLKRWVRELFRTTLAPLAGGHDLVVLFRRDPPADGHAELDREILALMPKAIASSASPGEQRAPGGGGAPA